MRTRSNRVVAVVALIAVSTLAARHVVIGNLHDDVGVLDRRPPDPDNHGDQRRRLRCTRHRRRGARPSDPHRDAGDRRGTPHEPEWHRRKTTPGRAGALVTSKEQTASGYPATAVHGYPADTVIWAVEDHGLPFRPDLVVSGINFGQNIGPLAADSGTVGAAREAVSLGVPALAASQGVDNGSAPDFSEAVPIVEHWVEQHRAQLLARSYGSKPPQANLNVPTCADGSVRGPVTTVLATSGDVGQTTHVDCTSTSTSYDDDLAAFEIGFATLTPLYPPG